MTSKLSNGKFTSKSNSRNELSFMDMEGQLNNVRITHTVDVSSTPRSIFNHLGIEDREIGMLGPHSFIEPQNIRGADSRTKRQMGSISGYEADVESVSAYSEIDKERSWASSKADPVQRDLDMVPKSVDFKTSLSRSLKDIDGRGYRSFFDEK
jgi:hypothetical protein